MRMSKPSGIAEMVVPVIVTAGISHGRIDPLKSIDDQAEYQQVCGLRNRLTQRECIRGRARSQGAPIPATTLAQDELVGVAG